MYVLVFFFKQKTAYEMRISDWSSDVCSSDLHFDEAQRQIAGSDEFDHRGEFIIIDPAHQHRVQFDAVKPSVPRRLNPAQHFAQPVMPGDRGKARRIERIDADIDRTHPAFAPRDRKSTRLNYSN